MSSDDDIALYDTEVNGRETTLRLSAADAKKRGLTGGRPVSTRMRENESAPVTMAGPKKAARTKSA